MPSQVHGRHLRGRKKHNWRTHRGIRSEHRVREDKKERTRFRRMESRPLQAETRATAQEEGEEVAPLMDESEGGPILETESQEVEASQRRKAMIMRENIRKGH